MIAALILPAALRQQLIGEARAAFPRECCGLIEGECEGGAVRALALHATANLAKKADRFEIDPAAQIALLRSLRGSGRALVGCYHSHPRGRPEMSPRDREGAVEEDFAWLIAALGSARAVPRLAAFVFAQGDFVPLPLLA